VLRLIQIRLATMTLQNISFACQSKKVPTVNRRFEFNESSQLSIGTLNEVLSVAVCSTTKIVRTSRHVSTHAFVQK
jgi:hypothetical protein